MALTLLQNELLLTLNAYLAGEVSMDDVRSWEVAVTDSREIGPAEAEMIERLALVAETVLTGAAEEDLFAAEARRCANRLEAEPTRA